MSKNRYIIGNTIKNARRGAGMSQIDLAEKIGVSYQQVQKYEKGASELTLSRLQQIAEILTIPLHTFFDDKNLVVSESSPTYGTLSNEEQRLLILFRKIKSDKTRKMAVSVVRTIMEEEK
jgi:transcriptional regulator with XRE-family HTH domain